MRSCPYCKSESKRLGIVPWKFKCTVCEKVFQIDYRLFLGIFIVLSIIVITMLLQLFAYSMVIIIIPIIILWHWLLPLILPIQKATPDNNLKHNSKIAPMQQNSVQTKEVTVKKHIDWVPALVLYSITSVVEIIIALINLEGEVEILPITILSLLISIPAIIFELILLFKCWKALPKQYREATPGKAVGFLLIPFYNFYWVFISFPKLAKGYYRYGQIEGNTRIRNMEGWGITYAILLITSIVFAFVPSISIVVSILSLLVFIIFYKAMSTYANRVLDKSFGQPKI